MAEILKTRPFMFWDIESLENMFTIAFYMPNGYTDNGVTKDRVIFMYLFDEGLEIPDSTKGTINTEVCKTNKLNIENVHIEYWNLANEAVNRELLKIFSVSSKQMFKDDDSNMFASVNPNPTSDLTDNDEPYYVGFNTDNYDLTMMARYFAETWGAPTMKCRDLTFMPTDPHTLRTINNILFMSFKDNMPSSITQEPAVSIYRNMVYSGKFVDACKVNDKLGKIALKRIEAMLGYDIVEFEGLNGKGEIDPSRIAELFAYNLSDCIKLACAFKEKDFMSSFDIKRSIINSYNDIVFDKDGKVREFRATLNFSSAKIVSKLLCPDGHLSDAIAVSTDYLGRNILAEQREWARQNLTPENFELIDAIFQYYAAFEGKNFDDSDHYREDYGFDALPVHEKSDIPEPVTTVPYFNKDGSWNGCYVNFSIGGIHGAEYAKTKFEQDMIAWEAQYKRVNDFVSQYSKEELEKLKGTVEFNGEKCKVSEFLTHKKNGPTVIKWPKKPELFNKTPSGKWQLNKTYTYCSNSEVDHDDFTSYYPSLLMNLKAYENKELGEDRYVEQFDNKTLFGKYMKDPNRSKEEQAYYSVARNGTKLILNSASGASDTAYDNNIRMNNRIISMRIIGQLFTWRIGQALSLEGFPVISTNTDGLYVVCDDTNRERCREILDREAKSINVGIEPEEMRLISKDANNRIELTVDGKVIGAGGGDVACYEGINITKSIAHPTLIDKLLVDYLKEYGCNEEFDYDKAIKLLEDFKATAPVHHQLSMYQMIVNSSVGTNRFVFAEINGKAKPLQHNNRAFIIKQPAAHLYIANGTDVGKEPSRDAVADEILRANGVNPEDFKVTRCIKVSKLAPEENVFIYNNDINNCSEEFAKQLIAACNDGYYINLLRDTYQNWYNPIPNV